MNSETEQLAKKEKTAGADSRTVTSVQPVSTRKQSAMVGDSIQIEITMLAGSRLHNG